MEPIIGSAVEVVAARNRTLVGITGTVTDERRSSFTIATVRGPRMVLKAHATFALPSRTVEGTALLGTIAERIKRM